MLIQPDVVSTKMNLVNLQSGTAAGGFSLEINAGGAATRVSADQQRCVPSNVIALGSGGQVVPDQPWLQGCTWGPAGLHLYLMDVNRAPGEIPGASTENQWVPSPTFPTDQDIYIGRWPTGVDNYNGVIGHLFWFNRQLTLGELETLAPMIRQVAHLPSFNAGNVQKGTSLSISMLNRGHPVGNFTLQRVTPNPTKGTATVPAGSTSVNYAANPTVTAGLDTFGVTLTTAELAVSAPATITVNVTDAVVVPPPQVFAHSYGPLAAGSNTVLDVLEADGHGAAATNLTNKDITLPPPVTSGFSRIDNVAPTNGGLDQIRFIAPSPTSLTSYTTKFSADGSPAVNVTVQVNAADATYTPFAFVTNSNPPYLHSGGPLATVYGSAKVDCRARPPYNAGNPRSVSKIDPMSGLEFFRVTGDRGTTVYRYDSSGNQIDTGLVFPREFRQVNNTKTAQTFNCDGSLLMIGERRSSGDPSNSVGSAILDCTGNRTGGTSTPFRIIRAHHSGNDLGDGNGARWMWSRTDPLLAYVPSPSGDGLYKWWPVGDPANGKAVGQRDLILAWPSGADFSQGGSFGFYLSTDGRYYMQPVRTSGGVWGGRRVDVITPSLGPFIANQNQVNDHEDRGTIGISRSGAFTAFTPGFRRPLEWNDHVFVNATSGAIVSQTELNSTFPLPNHNTHTSIDGVDYFYNHRATGGHTLWKINGGGWMQLSDIRGANPEHCGANNFSDRFEIVGDWAGHTGQRYGIWSHSRVHPDEPTNAIMGINFKTAFKPKSDSFNQCRYLCCHRSVRDTIGLNAAECHPQPDPTCSKIVFNSDWFRPGVTTDRHIHAYVLLIPDAWKSPNNDGT